MASARGGPIGVLDSGVGGLTVLRELLREVPGERFVYFGDTGNGPYGERSERDIQALVLAGTRFLLERDAKLIVVACNVASISALGALRAAFPRTPFVGTVPAVKMAAERTTTGVIGVATTTACARSAYLGRLIAEHARGVRVLVAGCPRLVMLVEVGAFDGPDAELAVRGYVQPLLTAGGDTLVLACTHFPVLRAVVERVVGPSVAVIDSGAAIARQTRHMLTARGLLAHPDQAPVPRAPRPDDECWCTGDVERFTRVASAILTVPLIACRASSSVPVAVADPPHGPPL
jgi:glutamate racemase